MTTWMRHERGGELHERSKNCSESCHSVVVIDPEDREAVERLLEFFHRAEDSAHPAAYCGSFACRTDSLREALREFGLPVPPEPTDFGTIVQRANGQRWVKGEKGWTNLDANGPYLNWSTWADVVEDGPVTVL